MAANGAAFEPFSSNVTVGMSVDHFGDFYYRESNGLFLGSKMLDPKWLLPQRRFLTPNPGEIIVALHTKPEGNQLS